jgi:hypothetical protein
VPGRPGNVLELGAGILEIIDESIHCF